jgi:hypothetical protein
VFLLRPRIPGVAASATGRVNWLRPAFAAMLPGMAGAPAYQPYVPPAPGMYMSPPQQYQQQLPPPQDQQQQIPDGVDQSALMSALHNLSLQNASSGRIADSGASTHLASDPGKLSHPTLQVSNYPPVYVGNGNTMAVARTMPISHVGSAVLPNHHHPSCISNVLVALALLSKISSLYLDSQLTTLAQWYLTHTFWL